VNTQIWLPSNGLSFDQISMQTLAEVPSPTSGGTGILGSVMAGFERGSPLAHYADATRHRCR